MSIKLSAKPWSHLDINTQQKEKNVSHYKPSPSWDYFLILKAIKEYDEFEEWIDGSAKLRYSPYSREAQAHISGWAMKYTNNHNKFVLKKTCVGVLLCSQDCTLPNGLKIVVRPAISDKG